MDKNLKCGFCKLGKEVESICGRLWHDEIHKCTAHQRCMQYSALLCQYKMKKFGGFKFREVLKEQARGNKLKCSVCQKLGKSSKSKVAGSASAGCAIQKCKKTFHFYCARIDGKAQTRRIVLGGKGGRQDTVVLYRVFCSKEHEEQFLESDMRLTEDSDNEGCSSSSTTDSDGGLAQGVEQIAEGEVSSDLDDENRKSKRIRLDSDLVKNNPGSCNSTKLPDDQTFVICFTENSRNIPPSKFETLVNQARELFQVEASSIFMWKYNMENFSCQHMLHLLLEIGSALCNRDESRLHHLICLLEKNDVAKFDDQISSCIEYENSSLVDMEKYSQSLRRKIVDLFEKVNKKFNSTVIKYCMVESLDLTHVAYLVLSDTTDATGDMRQYMKNSYNLNKYKEERSNGNCEKTFSVRELDLEANLFHDAQNSDAKIECKDSNIAEEEAKALMKWLKDENESFCGVEEYPKEELLLDRNCLTTIDHLSVLLKDLKICSGNNSPVVVVVKPLDGKTVLVAGYLRKCISKVIDEKLTDQHDVYMLVSISQKMNIRKVSEFLPDSVSSKSCGIGVRALRIGVGDNCSVVLHLCLNFEC